MSDELLKELELNAKTAEKLRALAHPARICIVRNLLKSGSCNVTFLREHLNMPQSTISQHLFKLKATRIIEGSRVGVEMYYKVVDLDIVRLVAAIF